MGLVHYLPMKAEPTLKQILAVRCPTCGAAPGQRCELSTGQPRTEPHSDRRWIAADKINLPMKKATLPVSPISLRCSFCAAGRGKPCKTSGGRKLRNSPLLRVSLVHVARIMDAAKLDLNLAGAR